MRQIMWLVGVMALCGVGMAQHSANDAGSMTVRGCLQRSRQNFVVVDHSGMPYALKGVTDKLKNEVGHEVEVKGQLTDDVKMGTRSEKQGSNPSDTVRAVEGTTLKVLNVSSDVRRVSDHCSSR